MIPEDPEESETEEEMTQEEWEAALDALNAQLLADENA